MNSEIQNWNNDQSEEDQVICNMLARKIDQVLPEAENKIWHKHPVWFLEGNPIVGYSRQKKGIRLMFWGGMGFEEDQLQQGTGKFKDASIFYNHVEEIDTVNLLRWLEKSRDIQWDYKNIAKRKGELIRLK